MKKEDEKLEQDKLFDVLDQHLDTLLDRIDEQERKVKQELTRAKRQGKKGMDFLNDLAAHPHVRSYLQIDPKLTVYSEGAKMDGILFYRSDEAAAAIDFQLDRNYRPDENGIVESYFDGWSMKAFYLANEISACGGFNKFKSRVYETMNDSFEEFANDGYNHRNIAAKRLGVSSLPRK